MNRYRPTIALIASLVLAVSLLAAPAFAAEGEKILRTGGAVGKPVRIEGPAPVYPPELKEERIEGVVVARTVITKEGEVESIEIVQSPDPRFDEAVRESLAQWRFEPATLDGEPVAVYYDLTINFRLDSGDSERDEPAGLSMD